MGLQHLHHHPGRAKWSGKPHVLLVLLMAGSLNKREMRVQQFWAPAGGVGIVAKVADSLELF